MTRPDLEKAKFTENADSNTAVRVVSGGDAFKQPELTDSVTFEYPSTTTEVIRFRQGGLSGTILKSLQLIYTNSDKSELASVEVL